MFKKKDKLSVGRPKLADSNLKKMSFLISAICFVMVIGLIFGGLLDLKIIGNTHKLKADVNTSTLCTSIPDSLKYDENTNPYGFKDVEFFSGVLEHSEISGSNDYVYNDSKYCDTITKEDLEKITHLNYFNNTISSANGIQYLTNLEGLNLGTAADIPNYNITIIYLSHNTKLTKVDLSCLYNSSIICPITVVLPVPGGPQMYVMSLESADTIALFWLWVLPVFSAKSSYSNIFFTG